MYRVARNLKFPRFVVATVVRLTAQVVPEGRHVFPTPKVKIMCRMHCIYFYFLKCKTYDSVIHRAKVCIILYP